MLGALHHQQQCAAFHIAAITACTAAQFQQLATSAKQALQDNKAKHPALAMSWGALCMMESITGLEIKMDSTSELKQLECALPQQAESSSSCNDKAAPWSDYINWARFASFAQQASLNASLRYELGISARQLCFLCYALQAPVRKTATTATAASTSTLRITTGSMATGSNDMVCLGVSSSDSMAAATCTAIVPYISYWWQDSVACISTIGTELNMECTAAAVGVVPLYIWFLNDYRMYHMAALSHTATPPLPALPEFLEAALVVPSAVWQLAERSLLVAFVELLLESTELQEKGKQKAPRQSVDRFASTYNGEATTATAATSARGFSYTAPLSYQQLEALAPAPTSQHAATDDKWKYWPARATIKKTSSNVVATSLRSTARGAERSPTREHSRGRSPQRRSQTPPRQFERLTAVAVPEAEQEPVQAAAPVRRYFVSKMVAALDDNIDYYDTPREQQQPVHRASSGRALAVTPRRGISRRALA
jgi:hypothetical protein